ncbi:DUF397 domain-containing protein [Nocardiopsis sp. N85]|uniref:DUF397 domain-containing protein n=1 Tax=Nocardiopsis sp. N85 TaxID=3029400 RepID=UPI00237F58F0|nr:DUF397 domain-containing protein [Nocardiopsis sp. N85]MDE3722143.1 DUF397 domain-containing protein [Nocardiopsis sp. N85]
MMTEDWKKSSYSNGTGGNCVEVAGTDTGAAVRDTRNRELGHLEFTAGEWTTLLSTLASS